MPSAAFPHGTDPLVERTAALCEALSAHLVPDGARQLLAARAGLLEPLRIAVVGRVKAGKSTLVNALLGRRIAPTAVGECTQVVTWYRYGSPDRAQLVMWDGTTRPLEILNGFPAELGVDPAGVERIEVHLQSAALRGYTLIDTPGLAGLTEGRGEATRRALLGEDASTTAADLADAILFLFRDSERSDELEFIASYAKATGALGASASGVIGVLSHADIAGEGPWGDADPFESAANVAARIARDQVEHLATMIPVAGLLAESARTGRVTEDDAAHLTRLRDVDPVELRLAEQLGPPTGIDQEVLDRLLRLAGPYLLARGRSQAASGAVEMQRWLEHRSGVLELEETIHRVFTRRSRPLQAERILKLARRLTQSHALDFGHGAHARDLLEQAEIDPVLHRLNELRALYHLPATGPDVESTRAELVTVLDFDDPWRRSGAPPEASVEDLREIVGRRRSAAQAKTSTARVPAVAQAARVLTRSYQLIGRQLG